MSTTDWSSWRTAIRNGNTTILVGAGVSADAPSRLPLAVGLVRALVRETLSRCALSADLQLRVSDQLAALRPEVLGDLLLEHLGVRSLDPLIELLSGRPHNAWHQFLARAMSLGNTVVTTNFDTLIESASQAIGFDVRTIATNRQAAKQLRSNDTRGVLIKVHGSIDRSVGQPSSLVLALRQVGNGLPRDMASLLRFVLKDRALIVVGYAGRDDFDLAPFLGGLARTAPTLWVVHDSTRSTIAPLRDDEKHLPEVLPALDCARRWSGDTTILIGASGEVRHALASSTRLPGTHRRVRKISSPFTPHKVRATLHGGLRADRTAVYALLQAQQFELAREVLEHIWPTADAHVTERAHVLHDLAVVLEKDAHDLREAEDMADRAIEAALDTRDRKLIAAALDQRGVVARRRGQYVAASEYYARALRAARGPRVPTWLKMQIRAHRAVVFDYLEQYSKAAHEHRIVLKYERRIGDLRSVAKSLNNLGIVFASMKRTGAAIEQFEASLDLKRLLDDRRGMAQTLHNLGRLHFYLDDLDAAEASFTESLRLRRLVDPHGVAQSLVALAHVANERGDLGNARTLAADALDFMIDFGDDRGVEQAATLLWSLPELHEA